DAAYNATMLVDTSVQSFPDPTTGAVQSNPYAGSIYVAWNTVDTAPSAATLARDFNPYKVKVMASTDGGANFTGQIPVTTTGQGLGYVYENYSVENDAAPRLAVSQGTANGLIPGGQLTVVFDNFQPKLDTSKDFINASSALGVEGLEPTT